MLFEDTYRTIENISQCQLRERSSKFIGIAYPVKTETQIKEIIATLKKEYYDATHHCYAYILGHDKSAYRINDDGEPSGTAGRPIYGQLQSKDLTNTLVVVVRYYGGTKLGVPGLISAYKAAAAEALDNASIIELTINEVYEIQFEYPLMNDVMRILKDDEVKQLSQQFDLSCKIEFSVRRNYADRITAPLKKLNGAKIEFLRLE